MYYVITEDTFSALVSLVRGIIPSPNVEDDFLSSFLTDEELSLLRDFSNRH